MSEVKELLRQRRYEGSPGRPPYKFNHKGREYIEHEFIIKKEGKGKDMGAYLKFKRKSYWKRLFDRGLEIPAEELKRDDTKQEWTWTKDN